MRRSTRLGRALALAFALAACGDHTVVTTVSSAAVDASATASGRPSALPSASALRVVKHAPSEKLTNLQPFIDAKCTAPANQRWTIGAGEEVLLDCSHATFVASSGCAHVVVEGSLRDLEPYHPIALCYAEDARPSNFGDPSKPEEKGDLGVTGCISRRTIAYLVEDKHGAFRVVRTWQELERLYAPITSPAEALSWMLLRGGDEWPRSEIAVPERAKLAIDTIDGTFAERAGDAFRVRLFRPEGCGCHPMELSAVDFLVDVRGAIRPEKEQRVYTSDQILCHD